MKIDQQKIRSALISAVEADKSKTLLGTPSHEAIEIVYLALETQHDLRDVAISNGQASNRFTRWAAAILLRRAYYKGGIDDAMAWLNRILQIQCCDYHIVMPLWGLKLEQSLDLTDQVRILPAKEFSQSENLIRFMRPSVEDLPIYRWQPPSSVLLKRQTFTSVFIKAGEIIEIDWTVIDHLHDMRNCLALAGPVAIAGDNQWIEFIDPDLRDFNSGVWRRAQEIQPHSLDFGSFDPELGKVLIPSFLNLTGKERDRIYLASDRFARALWRNEAGEAALELGITLDSLLGDGMGELTSKVSLRAALLIGGNLADRQRKREIVKSVYELRSKVVHNGKAEKTWKFRGRKMPTKDFVEIAIGVTAEVVRKIIILGRIPNWNDVELSGEVPN